MTASTLLTFEDWTLRLRPGASPAAPILLLLHGWTGDENSMWPFTRGLPADWWLLAPRAPYPAPASGYSWRPAQPGWPTFESMRPAAALLKDLLERWGIAYGVDTRQIALTGFSQGAAMSLVFSLCYPQMVRRAASLAGFLPAESDPWLESHPLQGKTIFWAHGTQDERVPLEMAQESIRLLCRAGAEVQYCQAEIGHKVSADCLRGLEKYLAG